MATQSGGKQFLEHFLKCWALTTWEHIILFHVGPIWRACSCCLWLCLMIYDARLRYKALSQAGKGFVVFWLVLKKRLLDAGTQKGWILSTAVGCWLYSTSRTTTGNTTTFSTSCQLSETLVIFSLFISPSGSILVIMWASRWYGLLLLETG